MLVNGEMKEKAPMGILRVRMCEEVRTAAFKPTAAEETNSFATLEPATTGDWKPMWNPHFISSCSVQTGPPHSCVSISGLPLRLEGRQDGCWKNTPMPEHWDAETKGPEAEGYLEGLP